MSEASFGAETEPAAAVTTCPSCSERVGSGAAFCEACGAELATTESGSGEPAGPAHVVAGIGSQENVFDQTSSRCAGCGQGHYLDGYCDVCGAPAPDPRAHFALSPSGWAAGVCHVGLVRTRNEDALALVAGDKPLGSAAIVVCDGVSTAPNSHLASLAAAQASCGVLDSPVPVPTLSASFDAAARQLLTRAVLAANTAVVATGGDPDVEGGTPSCTWVGGLVREGAAAIGIVGDSRAYWLPDDGGGARQLGRDDSWAAEEMAHGIPREQAESSARAHMITRWLGADAPPDLVPHMDFVALDRPGWLLLCSDGLWNYFSEATELLALLARVSAADHDPLRVAQALVDAANQAGGRDNITVAVVRVPIDIAPTPVPG